MTFVTEETDNTIRLKVEGGGLSIYEVVGLRDVLLSCLERGSAIEMDLRGVTICDTAGLQLLFAMRKTADQKKRGFCIDGVPEMVVETLKSAGLGAGEFGNPMVEQPRE